MKRINILFISGISAIILFIALTVIQAKIIKKEDMQLVWISNQDITIDTELTEKNCVEMLVPTSLIINTGAITNINSLQGKYAKEHINKGQIIFKQDTASKEELKIIDAVDGTERIAIKIKSAENAVAYQLKPKDRVHLYFTGKSNVIYNSFPKYGISYEEGKNDNSLQTAKIINDIDILGIYDEMGRSFENPNYNGMDTIVIAVEPKKAEMINNLRTQGTFDITR